MTFETNQTSTPSSIQNSAESLESLSFEQAIAFSKQLLQRADLPEAELQTDIANLVATENGARGFFVCYLTGDWQLADRPSQGVIQALKAVPQPSAELLVKNLAMSTAMAIAHRRINNETQAQGSDLVAKRTANLISLLKLDEIDRLAREMSASAQIDDGNEDGKYSSFLKKWGYDQEQKNAIRAAIAAILT
jgi:hypothetical protein